MQWINPDVELPPVTSLVVIAIGTEQNKISGYKLAKMGSSGAFVVDAYPQSNCLYSEKSPHRKPLDSQYANNAYRVIAWCHFEECNLDDIKEPVETRFFAIDKNGKEVSKAEYDKMTPVERSYLAYNSNFKPLFDYMGVDNE